MTSTLSFRFKVGAEVAVPVTVGTPGMHHVTVMVRAVVVGHRDCRDAPMPNIGYSVKFAWHDGHFVYDADDVLASPTACAVCDKPVTNHRGTLWHTGDPHHQLSDHQPTLVAIASSVPQR